MKMLPLFDLYLGHPYYDDGRSTDFTIDANQGTLKLLNNHRCLLKPTPHGIRVLISVADDGSPFLPISQNAVFGFHLRLQNPDFALFTDLSELAGLAAPLYTNAGLSSAEALELALVSRQAYYSEGFAVRESAQAEAFTLRGNPLLGIQAADIRVEALGDIPRVTEYDPAAKIVTVNSQMASVGSRFTVTYEVAPAQGWGLFADVEIHNNASLRDLSEGPTRFGLTFKAKTARWKYYVVTNKGDSQFRIEDRDESPLVFSDDSWRDLSREPDESDEVAKTLAQQYPDLRRIRFVSDEPVPCRQGARKSIHLKMNGDQVGGVLPNPSPRNYSTVEVARNGDLQREDSLFQVVKFIQT